VKALLDTHTFLWWNLNDPQLSPTARSIISDSRTDVYLSAASAWEIAIKAAKGRLVLPDTPERYVASRIFPRRIRPLPILVSHAVHVFSLPNLHHDPFDRLLIAQSQLERMPLLTADGDIARYAVDIIW
jgi:PIN domain nuclease of toxin-antitoxin system